MMTILKRVLVIVLMCSFLLIAARTALAVGSCWYQGTPYLCSNHETEFIDPLDRRMTGFSTGSFGGGTMDMLEVMIREKDRCKNANGTWQSWQTYASHGRAGFATTSSGVASAQGTYQTCQYGHAYRNESDHHYYDVPQGIDLWKYLTSS
jgi:hypothetical protein